MKYAIEYIARTRQAAIEKLYFFRLAKDLTVPEVLLVSVEDALRGLEVDGLVTVRATASVYHTEPTVDAPGQDRLASLSVDVGALEVEFVEG